jgi:hypothetical protein
MEIRDDLKEDTQVPIQWTGNFEDEWLGHTDTLEIELGFHSDNQLTDEGYNIVIYITDSSKGWGAREAFAISADFDF